MKDKRTTSSERRIKTLKSEHNSSVQSKRQNLLPSLCKQQHFVYPTHTQPAVKTPTHAHSHTKQTRKRLAKNKQGSFVLCKQLAVCNRHDAEKKTKIQVKQYRCRCTRLSFLPSDIAL